ncbi:MFS transporter [Alicyclobacillus sp. ALC3]|uniref:MFS transporter n=1 Tax=Alicyclobacillus sp. ALC3 TaxID=2796143 RepID=UPI002379E278|nr:MFS transporter [Alicyclobacillus sp. ALC3]WDL98310.1 MFS transporter [Alicyclobacillus sp. ALC3]
MRFRDFHRNVKIRIIVGFAFSTAQATTFPFMAIYFAHNFGQTTAGIVLALAIVASLFSGAIGGYYADRVGRRKVMLVAELAFLVAYIAMAVANLPKVNSPLLTLVGFFTTNVCWGIYGPAEEAMLLDVTRPEDRTLMYTIFYWMVNFTMAVGTSVGALLFETHRFVLFAAMSVVVFGTWLSTLLLIEETYRPSTQPESVHPILGMLRSYRGVLSDPVFLRYIVAGLLTMYGEFQMQGYIGVHFAQSVVSQPLVAWHNFVLRVDGVKLLGWVRTENTILVVLLATAAVRFTRGRSERWALWLGLGLQTAGYTVITYTSTPFVALIAMAFATVGEVTNAPIRQSYLGDLAPERARSAYVAVNGMTFQGTQLLTSLGVALGAVVPSWGMAVICLVLGTGGILLYQSIVPSITSRRLAVESTQVSNASVF